LNRSKTDFSIYKNTLLLLLNYCSIKNFGGNIPENINKKINTQLNSCYTGISSPKDYLKYSDGETLKEKSPGYNSEKYLEIILNNPSSKTIFIDQPEDNLGNRFIAEGLVEILRKIKFHKQVFLVTHNPSIVVYGDAESIIIAKNDENKICYKQIVLENKDAQKEICNILDGGEYIFDNRAKKYNIQRILKNA
jgi:predicted ATPase